MSVLSADYGQALWQWVVFLKDPTPSSWVARLAFTFRFMAYAAVSPIIVLALLDIAAYMIARTIGAPSGKGRARQMVTVNHETTPPTIAITSSLDNSEVSTRSNGHGTHDEDEGDDARLSPSYPADSFSNPGELLSGAGLFSPPQSRPGSPGVQRKRHRSESVTSGDNSNAGSFMEDEEGSMSGLDLRSDKSLRKRNVVAPMSTL